MFVHVYYFKVGDAMTLGNQQFMVNGGGGHSANSGQEAVASLSGQTVRTANRVLWGAGKFLLTTGEALSNAWDATLNVVLRLYRAGSAAYDVLTSRVGHVPVIGFGAGGVGEAIHASLNVAESTIRHDLEARRQAFQSLRRKMTDAGDRLSSGTMYSVPPTLQRYLGIPDGAHTTYPNNDDEITTFLPQL